MCEYCLMQYQQHARYKFLQMLYQAQTHYSGSETNSLKLFLLVNGVYWSGSCFLTNKHLLTHRKINGFNLVSLYRLNYQKITYIRQDHFFFFTNIFLGKLEDQIIIFFFCIFASRYYFYKICRGCCSHDRMVVGFITTCAINAYHH